MMPLILAGAPALAANLADASYHPFSQHTAWERWDDGYACHAPVGSYRSNPFGFHDMHGNVREWVLDDFPSYAASPMRAGDGLRVSPDPVLGVLRGGGFLDSSLKVRCSVRFNVRPIEAPNAAGVRPALASAPDGER